MSLALTTFSDLYRQVGIFLRPRDLYVHRRPPSLDIGVSGISGR